MSQSPAHLPLIRALSRLRSTFWRRRLLHGLVRAGWLSLLVPTVVMAGYLWLEWQVPWPTWLSGMLLVAALTLIWSLRPLSLKAMTHRLDRLLATRSGLITAFEVSQAAASTAGQSGSNPVADRLVADAVNRTVDLRRQIKIFSRGFWLEMNTLISVAAILGALILFDVLTATIPSATPLDLPPAGQEPDPDEVDPLNAQLFPPPFQQPPQPLTQAQIEAALEALADALRDQAVTRAAAEAIDQGDLGAAAEALRRLADQLEGLSDEARQELGQSLQEASEAMGGDVPGFSQPLQQGSRSLENGDSSGGSEALEELAETLDSLGGSTQAGGDQSGQAGEEESQSPGETGEGEVDDQPPADDSQEGGGSGVGEGEGGEGDQSLGEEEERLPIDGQPLELESETDIEERVLQPSELDAQAGEGRTSDSPFARQPLNAAGEDLGADPLTYPWEKRDVVRKYFTPAETGSGP